MRVVRVDERDDRAAEAAAGHPRRDGAVRIGELDEPVELRRRHLEVVPQALVAFTEERAERTEVACAQRLDDREDAAVLGLDVT